MTKLESIRRELVAMNRSFDDHPTDPGYVVIQRADLDPIWQRLVALMDSPDEQPSKPDAEFLSLVGHCSNCSCQDCHEFFKADARARVELPSTEHFAKALDHPIADEITSVEPPADHECEPNEMDGPTCMICGSPMNRGGES